MHGNDCTEKYKEKKSLHPFQLFHFSFQSVLSSVGQLPRKYFNLTSVLSVMSLTVHCKWKEKRIVQRTRNNENLLVQRRRKLAESDSARDNWKGKFSHANMNVLFCFAIILLCSTSVTQGK